MHKDNGWECSKIDVRTWKMNQKHNEYKPEQIQISPRRYTLQWNLTITKQT